MLKKILLTHENVDISSFEVVKSFMKTNGLGYSPKQSRIFTREEINTFLKDAPEDYSAVKVAVIFGIFGGCRREELYNVSVGDVVDSGSSMIVSIPKTKTGRILMFSIIDDEGGMDIWEQFENTGTEDQKTSLTITSLLVAEKINVRFKE